MILRRLQFFLPLLLGASASLAGLQPGAVARFTLQDVDGQKLSTADGHVTIITVVTRQTGDTAQTVADLVPDRYIGSERYRFVTLVNFQRKLALPFQGMTRLVIRQRLESEAAKLRPDYERKKIGHDPRRDLFVVADFDGSAMRQLGLAPESDAVEVFVFNGHGKVVQHWTGVPPKDAMPNAIAAAAE